MPLINGKKFACEPCIRGHRATSCQHTDRVLVEVRKPGRPMQTCGHHFATCVCGRLADVFPIEASVNYEARTLATAAPQFKITTGIRKAKLKTSRSSNSQRQEKTRASTEPRKSTSPLPMVTSRDLAEQTAVNIRAGELAADLTLKYTPPIPPIQPGNFSADSISNSSVVKETPRSTSLPSFASLLSRTQGFLSMPPINVNKEYSSIFHHNTTSSSLIEDISITPNPVDVFSNRCNTQTHVRTQYIMAKRDDRWRAAIHWQGEV